MVNELSSEGTCFVSLSPSHCYGYWFFPPRLKQYFVAFTDCQSHLSVVLSCYLPQSVCLGCSCISIPVPLTSLSIAFFLASFASFGLSWSCLGLSSCFTAWKWHSCQCGTLECIPADLCSLAEPPASGCSCSGPAPSIPLLGVGAASWLFLLTNCSSEHVGWSFCPTCPCKSGQDWSLQIYMYSMKHEAGLGPHRGSRHWWLGGLSCTVTPFT